MRDWPQTGKRDFMLSFWNARALGEDAAAGDEKARRCAHDAEIDAGWSELDGVRLAGFHSVAP
jgi:hypothetical protein